MNNAKDFLEAYSLSNIYKIVLEYTLKRSQLNSSSDNKKILLTTRNVRLDSGHYATKYHSLEATYLVTILDALGLNSECLHHLKLLGIRVH